jgi:hypothetical protein
MSTLSHVTAVPLTTAIVRFARHFLEMCVVMCGGGVVLNIAVFGAIEMLGAPDVVTRAPQLSIMIVAGCLASAMAVYMAARGHPVRHNVEMSVSTLAGGLLVVAASWLGALPGSATEAWLSLFAFMCGPLCLLMFIVMAARFEHYGGRVGTPSLADAVAATGEYSCPMHPEVRASGPGRCPICDMRLTVRA